MIKPASSACNLRCSYCFYADVSSRRSVPSYGMMSETTARRLIDSAFRQTGGRGAAHFAFQGGEPTAAGLPFYQSFAEYAEKTKPAGVEVTYSIQTNGILLDDAWCRLLRERRFLVGLSFDGTPKLHDAARVDAGGNPTAKRVLAAAGLLLRHGIDFNILTVVTGQSAKHPAGIFDFLQKNNFRYVQLIPCLNPLEDAGPHPPYELTPRLYGAFLKDLFRLWYAALRGGNYVSIRLFDNLARMFHGERPEQCGLDGRCRLQFVVEADGGVYPCDFYVLDEYRAGNICEQSFEELAKSEPMERFLREPGMKSPLCGGCGAAALCGGSCKRCRPSLFAEEGYCPYRDFLSSTADRFRAIARML